MMMMMAKIIEGGGTWRMKKHCEEQVPPIFSEPFEEAAEVFVLAKSLGRDSRKVKALFQAGFGPGLGNVLDICGTQK